tara:strand:- start:7236 stop:7484 length:249 start_codon:yes stop_codon:yes gene_type:complete
MNDMEELVNTSLKAEYGEVWVAMNEEEISTKLEQSKKLYDIVVVDYRDNQSARNYNLMITAMLSLQYWTQKRSNSFTISEDF